MGLWGIVSRAETFPETGPECYARFITHRDRAYQKFSSCCVAAFLGHCPVPSMCYSFSSTKFQRHYPQSTRIEQTVYSAETRKQQFSSEDEIGLGFQHVFSADGVNEYTGTCWIVNSGATSHICSNQRLFVELERPEQPQVWLTHTEI